MDRKTENLLYNISRSLFEDESGYDPTGGTAEYAKGNPNFIPNVKNMWNKTVDWFDHKNPWSPLNKAAAQEAEMANYKMTPEEAAARKQLELDDIRARDAADAQNEESLNAYNQRLKAQELADIRARDAADNEGAPDLNRWANKQRIENIGKNPYQGQDGQLAPVLQPGEEKGWLQKIGDWWHGVRYNPDGTPKYDPNKAPNGQPNVDLSRYMVGADASPAGTGLPGDPLALPQKSLFDRGLDWIGDHKLETGLAAGVPVALAGGYMAYRKLKNRDQKNNR